MVECCMCGDVGFAEHLFQCGKCRFRFQYKYCSRRYFYEDHIEFCDWCFVESDKTSGFTANLHSHTKSKPPIIKKVDGKRSNGSNSIRSRSANGSTVKAKGNEGRVMVKCNDRKANVPLGLIRTLGKTNKKNTPGRNRRRIMFLHEILC
eukprot:PITA_04570